MQSTVGLVGGHEVLLGEEGKVRLGEEGKVRLGEEDKVHHDAHIGLPDGGKHLGVLHVFGKTDLAIHPVVDRTRFGPPFVNMKVHHVAR